MTRSALGGAKIRAGSKMTVDTSKMELRSWPIIEVWAKAKRRYLPLSIGGVWRYSTTEERDAIISKLQSTNP